MLSRPFLKKGRPSEVDHRQDFLVREKHINIKNWNHRLCLHRVFWKPVCFFFPKKKAAVGISFFMFPLFGIFCSFSRGSALVGSGGTFAMLRHVVVEKTSTTFWGVWGLGGQPQKRSAWSEKQGDFYFEHDVTLSLIYCLLMYVWTHILNSFAARCHVPCVCAHESISWLQKSMNPSRNLHVIRDVVTRQASIDKKGTGHRFVGGAVCGDTGNLGIYPLG